MAECTTLTHESIEILRTELQRKVWSVLQFYPNQNSLLSEIPEQIVSVGYIDPEDRVVEFGGSIGRNSCVINSLLKNRRMHVVVEPSRAEIATLERNRRANGLLFSIENSALSRRPLYSIGWRTSPTCERGALPVPVLHWSEFRKKYEGIDFNTIVADCEGTLPDMIEDFPQMLTGITKILIEHDFITQEKYERFHEQMRTNHFTCIVRYPKNAPYAPGTKWPDGIARDPCFVSVWTRPVCSRCHHEDTPGTDRVCA